MNYKLDFNKFKHNICQIDNNVTSTKSKWVVACGNCQCERIVSYCQIFNIIKNKSNINCRICRIELGQQKISYKHLNNIRHLSYINRNGIKRPKNAQLIQYRKLFAPELLSNPQMKEKQRIKKLGLRDNFSNNWQGGKTKENQLLRSRDEYKQWRTSVFERDNYTCTICSKIGNKLNADHIKEWCNYPELRFDINNGRTLCVECHKKTDNYGYKAISLKRELKNV